MTTYTISGFRLDWRDTDDYEDVINTNLQPNIEMTVVADNGAGFRYSILEISDDEIEVDIRETANTYSIFFDGIDAKNSSADIEAGLMTVTWRDSSGTHATDILSLDVEYGDDFKGRMTGSDYIFVMGGDPIPEFSNLQSFETFDDNAITGIMRSTNLPANTLIKWGEVAEVGSRDDDIFGTSGNDVRHGRGDDYFISSQGNDTYRGGPGYDQVTFQEDPSGVIANLATGRATDGWGDTDKMFSIEMLRGSLHDDKFIGNNGANIFRGLAGNDTINGAGGLRDEVRYDRDIRHGGDNGVTVNLKKQFAIDGFGDRDKIVKIEDVRGTETKDDRITGSNGANVLEGMGGKDKLFGMGGHDTLEGGGGADRLVGNGGADRLNGGGGFDILIGNVGQDVLQGGRGNDRLDGGNGDDRLSGDAGADIFIFRGNFGADTIVDFQTAGTREKINLRGVDAIQNFQDLKENHLSGNGSDTVIDAGDGNTITLEGISMDDLRANDFIF